MDNKRIFTFWEPVSHLLPYLRLCRETWDIYLPKYEIITLDYSNLKDYVQDNVYKLSELKKLPLPVQKDAIMVAVLQTHGGIFMDIDTIILGDIKPIIDKLFKTEVVMLGYHMAFLATKNNSRLLTYWLKETQSRIEDLQNSENINVSWDYLGNGALTQAMEEMKKDLAIEVFLNRLYNAKLFDAMKKYFANMDFRNSRILSEVKKLITTINSITRKLYFLTLFRKNLISLNRIKYGYILEAVHIKAKEISAKEKYSMFWFGKDRGIENVISRNPIIIGLHNSWTPEWYKDLSKEDILKDGTLLSKTLDYAINANKN